MLYLTIGFGLFALLCLLYAVHCYRELYSWARQCQSAQIAVSYKQKVKLVAPLVEWLLWTKQLKGSDANGRVIYSMGGTSVALIKKRETKWNIRQGLKLGRKKKSATATPPVREVPRGLPR